METYATVLAYAIPGFIVLIIIESLVARWKGMHINQPMDLISSLSSGITNTLKTLMGLSVVIISYDWMVSKIGIWDLQATPFVYVLAFIGLDFKGYWSHRLEHQFNILWNRHVIHHSSEEYNLACALRQEISAIFGVFFFLFIPLAILGVPTKVIAITAPLHLFAQFWYHTRVIDKMGFLEYIVVTPSHHRVHHAINDIYLDKNFSQIFIFWDKWFGTFQEELEDEPPVYGTKRPAKTWNPVFINFMHFWALLQDAWYTRSWWDKFRLFFMPTGWRPQDVMDRYPIAYYKKASEQIKYTSHPSAFLTYWSWLQLVINFGLLFHFMSIIGDISLTQIMLYGSFLLVSVIAYTSLMDQHISALIFESIKMAFGVLLLYQYGSWFGINDLFAWGTWAVLAYLGVSLLMSFYFMRKSPRFSLVDEK